MIGYPKYHKIQSVFLRDPANHHKTFMMGEWAEPAFSYLAEDMWVATEKIDGTNMRLHIADPQEGDSGSLVAAFFRPGDVGRIRSGVRFKVGGRNENSEIPVPLMERMSEIGNRAGHLNGLTLYGEGYGAGIQKGGGYRSDMGFILFDVMVTETGTFLERGDVEDIALKMDLPYSGPCWYGTLMAAVNRFRELDDRPLDSLFRESEAEGWVLRPQTELRDRLGHRVITKMKVKDFPKEEQS